LPGGLVTALAFLWLLWRRGVLMLPRPLRMPMRLHAELGLATTDAQVNIKEEVLERRALCSAGVM